MKYLTLLCLNISFAACKFLTSNLTLTPQLAAIAFGVSTTTLLTPLLLSIIENCIVLDLTENTAKIYSLIHSPSLLNFTYYIVLRNKKNCE